MMNKDNLVALANTSAIAGTGTGSLAFLSDNSSSITVLVVVSTLAVTIIAHVFDKLLKHQKNKIDTERVVIENKKLKSEEKKIELENRKLELENRKFELELDLRLKDKK